MRRQMTSYTLMLCGVLALALGLLIGPAPAPASAMPALQPSPRPTLVPTSVGDTGDDKPTPTPIPPGRVTGTVIDLRTSAPVPNILVAVGDSLVISDRFGNYERWVTTGYYNVGLQLRAGEGTSAQGMQKVAVGPGDSVFVHLFFTSPAPAVAPVVEAPPVVTTPVALPSAPELPGQMPETSVERARESHPMRVTAPAPASLPLTAASAIGAPTLWVMAGAAMLSLGALLHFTTRRRHAEVVLKQLLNSKVPPRSDEGVLEDLLHRDV